MNILNLNKKLRASFIIFTLSATSLITGCFNKAIPDGLVAIAGEAFSLAQLQIAPTSAKLIVSNTQQFTASYGSAPYVYSIVSGGGTISTSGLYTAPSSSASSVVVRVTDSLGSTSDAVVAVSTGPLISPTSAAVEVGGTVSFAATGGVAPLTWSVSSGAGSVSGAGLFSAPGTHNTSVVTVTDAEGFSTSATTRVFVRNKVWAGGSTRNFRSCVLTGNDGGLRCFGGAGEATLGDGLRLIGDDVSEMGENLPRVRLGTGRTPLSISAGIYSTCAILDDNSVKCWGYASAIPGYKTFATNTSGSAADLGDNLFPVTLAAGRTASEVSVDSLSACVRMDNNNVACWGGGGYGTNGQGTAAIIGDSPANNPGTYPAVILGTTALKIATGGQGHNCALLTGGGVKCWGINTYGQLGQGSVDTLGDNAGEMAALNPIILGAAATDIMVNRGGDYGHSCAILTGGAMKCWGLNNFGQLGIGNIAYQGDAAGEMAALGTISLGTGRTASKMCGTRGSTCAVLDNGQVKCWGDNAYGELGYEHTNRLGDGGGEMGDALPYVNLGAGLTATDISCGRNHVCATLNNGGLKCWGSNEFGQLGIGDLTNRGHAAGTMGDNLPQVDVAEHTIVQVSAGGYNTCAVLNDGSVNYLTCWGLDRFGHGGAERQVIGDEPSDNITTLAAIDLGTTSAIADVILGVQSTCVQFADGTAKCFGMNTGYGEFGLNLATSFLKGLSHLEMGTNLAFVSFGIGRTAKFLAGNTANATSCVILDNDELKCWGQGTYGATGQDSAGTFTNIPVMPAVNVGAGRYATKVSTKSSTTCAVLDNATLKCWGYNNAGQLGKGHLDNLGDDPGEMAALTAIDLGTGRTALDVCTANASVCAHLDNNTVKCWGQGSFGETGQESSAIIGDGGGEMGDALPAINLGTGRTVKKITCAGSYYCAILDNDRVKCWGNNTLGYLGIGNITNRGSVPGTMGESLPFVNLGTGRTAVDISGGQSHVCAVLDDNTVKCWGYNAFGQLGQGHLSNIGDNPGEMGDNLPGLLFQ